MFLHIVHFWLKPDLTDAQREQFLAGLRAVAKSPNTKTVRIHVPDPAPGAPRPVVDNTYDFQLCVEFTDAAAHDRYQSADDAVHQAFITGFKSFWTKVLIYDSVPA